MKKNKLFVTLLIFILITSFGISVVAQEETSSLTTDEFGDSDYSKSSDESSGETPIIDDDDKVITVQPEVEPAPQWIIDKINDYITSMVGEDYFVQHFQLQQSQTNINLDKIGAKYVLYYIYTHDLKDQPNDVPYQVEHQFTLRADPDGELVEYRGTKYRGPKKPYQFLISRSEANSTAIEYGLQTPIEVSLSYGDQGYNSDTPIEEGTYVWVVWTKKCVNGLNIEGLYIDVDTGNVISKKTSNRTCIGGEDEEIVPLEIKVNKEPPSDAKTKELVSAVILDKYTRSLTWAERPENFKEICSIEKYPNPILREQCQIDILEYEEVEAPFVKIKIKYLEALKKDTEEEVDCLVYLGRGISASENEDFTNLEVGESYEGTYFIRKSSKNWTRFIELGDEYCEFEYSHGLVPFLGKAGNTMNEILGWIVNLFK